MTSIATEIVAATTMMYIQRRVGALDNASPRGIQPAKDITPKITKVTPAGCAPAPTRALDAVERRNQRVRSHVRPLSPSVKDAASLQLQISRSGRVNVWRASSGRPFVPPEHAVYVA